MTDAANDQAVAGVVPISMQPPACTSVGPTTPSPTTTTGTGTTGLAPS